MTLIRTDLLSKGPFAKNTFQYFLPGQKQDEPHYDSIVTHLQFSRILA